MPRFSVVVPAHNEQQLLGRCLESIEDAALVAQDEVEVVVVANRCTDGTADVAVAHGARVVEDASTTIGAVRNAGARVARGDVLITLDADSCMAMNTFVEVDRALLTGRFVGGGASFEPERRSPGIVASLAVVRLRLLATRLGGAMFWCHRGDFEAIGGFDESLPLAEDLDFARRLRRYGRLTSRRFTNLRLAPVTVSCRTRDLRCSCRSVATATVL